MIVCAAVFAGCGGNVGQTVMQDFGLQERPDDYVSGTDRVMQSMQVVGETELKRLNTENRRGELVYDDSENLQGRFYKKVKVYTRAYPLEASPEARRSNRKNSGYVGIIEYSYQIYEGRREPNRTEAEAADAEIPTGITGRDRFRYRFTSSGNWTGNKGEPITGR